MATETRVKLLPAKPGVYLTELLASRDMELFETEPA